MTKGLEALNEIKEMLDAPYTSGVIKQGLNVIEKELKAFEIIKKYPKVRNSLQNFRYMVNYWQKNNVVVTTKLLRTYDFPYELEEYELLKEVML